MAKAFLDSVSEYIHTHYKDTVENLCIVLPNKRASLFLKSHLARRFAKTLWLPKIISAEEFITELSGLKTLEEIDLICHLYESYKFCYGEKAENFDSFAKWGQLILQDFNEIDRYLADSKQLYENLKDIKVIEHWSLGEEQLTEHQKNYIEFMASLGAIYQHYTSFLLRHNLAYQGLAYRKAVINQEKNEFADSYHKILLCGFNALNAAELKLFLKLKEQNKAEFLWDADSYYLEDKNQEAGLFLRNNFQFFSEKNPLFIETHFKTDKEISIISVPKQMGQAQVVKQTLQRMLDENIPMDKVALVLANEKLLWPILQQLPEAIEHVNITMEYPVKYSSSYALIEALIHIQTQFSKQNKTHKTIYHYDLIHLLRQAVFQTYLKSKAISLNITNCVSIIAERNLSFLSQKNLEELFGTDYTALKPLFHPEPNIALYCKNLKEVLTSCIKYFIDNSRNNQHQLELEYLHIVLKNFNRLDEILSKYGHFNDILSFKQLFTQIVGTASVPFLGEPLRGLQIMGVLETRTLDFDHVILVNVNEGVLPSGKTINSFIPNDLKRAFGLPLYLEKDAIYAYHFYRLLQRAKDITITYDSETDTFGKGEKSRFVTQLQLELQRYHSHVNIKELIATSPDFPEELPNQISIQKNESTLKEIVLKATDHEKYGGLSPSGLIAYKECGLKFYFRYSARLKESKEVEESAEANTFGSILHLSLESIYKDFLNQIISPISLKEKMKEADAIVNSCFSSFFDNMKPVGKSVLQQEVIKVYVKKLIQQDIKFISHLNSQNHHLSLVGLEQEFSAPLTLQLDGKKVEVFVKGKIDRLDSHEGLLRIIDYKSSVKSGDKFKFTNFEDLFYNTDYNKQLQLFIYSWLVYKSGIYKPDKIRACIIPFKVFSEEPKYILEDKKALVMSDKFLLDFENALIDFISSIFNSETSFQQTVDKDICEYCTYKVICNR